MPVAEEGMAMFDALPCQESHGHAKSCHAMLKAALKENARAASKENVPVTDEAGHFWMPDLTKSGVVLLIERPVNLPGGLIDDETNPTLVDKEPDPKDPSLPDSGPPWGLFGPISDGTFPEFGEEQQRRFWEWHAARKTRDPKELRRSIDAVLDEAEQLYLSGQITKKVRQKVLDIEDHLRKEAWIFAGLQAQPSHNGGGAGSSW